MKNDKIIQLIDFKNKLIGLSDSGKVYEYIDNEWEIMSISPDRELSAKFEINEKVIKPQVIGGQDSGESKVA